MATIPDGIDLAQLSQDLRARLGDGMPRGHATARTVFRDAIVALLGCSEAQGEALVETLIARGFLRPTADPGQVAAAEIAWEIRPDAGAA